jgi:tetratricopeptide (TPR) repeat protein
MNPYQDALQLLNNNKTSEAEAALMRLLNEDFDNPVLQFALGMTFVAQRKTGAAHALLRRSLERLDDAEAYYRKLGIFQPDSSKEGKRRFVRQQKAECLMGIGMCYRYEDDKTEAQACFERGLALAPNHSDLHANIGCMFVNDGRPEGGVRWLTKALEIEPEHPEAKFNLGLLQLEMGQWKEGFANYDEGSHRKNGLGRVYTHPDGSTLPMWDGSAGKRVVVYGEQGIGDEIMFASCVPDLKKASELVVLDCHPRLKTLFERSFGVECHGTRKNHEYLEWDVAGYNFNARSPIGSLGRHYRANGEFSGAPYLITGRNKVVDALPGPKIGLAWIGGYKETRATIRSMNLAEMMPILRRGASFVSLQYTDCRMEIAHAERQCGKRITQFDFISDQKSDYDLTAEVVNSLDLVIAINTSAVHLAGALGKECWTLTPDRPAWRYTTTSGEKMPWYGSVRQFRQGRGEPWANVIERVCAALDQRFGKEAIAA